MCVQKVNFSKYLQFNGMSDHLHAGSTYRNTFVSQQFYVVISISIEDLHESSSGNIPGMLDPAHLPEICDSSLHVGTDDATIYDVDDDEQFLDFIQRTTLEYFRGFACPLCGCARETMRMQPECTPPLHGENLIAIGGTGMGLAALVVGAHRGFLPRQEAAQEVITILAFLVLLLLLLLIPSLLLLLL